MTLYEYLVQKYKETHFPFTRKVEILNLFPESELNELLEYGQVKERVNPSGDVIELIINQ